MRALPLITALWLVAAPVGSLAVDRSIAVRDILAAATAERDGAHPGREAEILEDGIQRLGPGHPDSYPLYRSLTQFHSDRGNLVRALAAAEAAERTAGRPAQRYGALISQMNLHTTRRDFPAAERLSAELRNLLSRLRNGPRWASQGRSWEAQSDWAHGNLHFIRGQLAEAQESFHQCLAGLATTDAPVDTDNDFVFANCSAGLLGTLVQQGRLAEAAAQIALQRQIAERVASASRRPALLARLSHTEARILIEQGNLDEAARLAAKNVDTLLALGASESSVRVASNRLLQAQVAMLRGDWPEALSLHTRRQAWLRDDPQQLVRGDSVDHAYTLIRLGRIEDARTMLQGMERARQGIHEEDAPPLLEVRLFLAMALAADGSGEAALNLFRRHLPTYLQRIDGERASSEAGVLRTSRLNWLLDAYLDLLAEAHERAIAAAETGRAAQLAAEGFRWADLARNSSVQRALAAAASRHRPEDPALAELARQAQDLENQMGALGSGLADLLGRGRIAEHDRIVADMRRELGQLRQAHARVSQTLAERFPQYASLLAPQPLEPAQVRPALATGEVLISLYSTHQRTLVWAVPASGEPAFVSVPWPRQALKTAVDRLRRQLDPDSLQWSAWDEFDTTLAHQLHARLIAPVLPVSAPAEALIVVPHGPLAQLPLAVLLSAPWSPPVRRSGPRFAALAEAPWLIKRYAITQLPSVLTLPLLRSRREPAGELAFAGFGNPEFAPGNLAGKRRGTVRGGLERRNLRLQASTAPENAGSSGSVPGAGGRPPAAAGEGIGRLRPDLGLLSPLPDTAEEILAIGKLLQAIPERDIFLGQRASEAELHRLDLRPYRVLMFATHGLVPGELPGLDQPALALSRPPAERPEDDGLLSMDEILALRLNADWVVLSACNTAAGRGQGEEALSGLGRAFFYAGARALLLTQWPVETVSARLLTTETFAAARHQPERGRAAQLQAAMLRVMQRDSGQGFSYAHPMFWAPYVLVGDGR